MNLNKNFSKITPQKEDFAKWYSDTVFFAKLAKHGPVKGTIFFLPNSFLIWENIKNKLDISFSELNVKNVSFPLLFPYSLLQKEKEHIKGFAPESALITQVGQKKLEEPLVIRPTSEILFCEYFKGEINSYKDLPILLNQWCNVVRWEKNTKPFLRNSEFLWQEGHTIHALESEAKNTTETIANIYKKFIEEELGMYCILGKKTQQEKFAGSVDTMSIEILMPDGQCLQSATSHYLGQNFSSKFGIKYLSKEQKHIHPFQTSWGISTRIIGALIMSHGDDYGLVLPPNIAPIQIDIILAGKISEELLNAAKKIKNNLSKKYRVNLDISEKSYGYKVIDSETKGTPLRIDIGEKELANNEVAVTRRDERYKELVKFEDLENKVCNLIGEIQNSMFEKTYKNSSKNIIKVDNMQDFITNIENKKMVLVPFSLDSETEEKIKKEYYVTSRCISLEHKIMDENCFFDNTKKAKAWVYFAKAY